MGVIKGATLRKIVESDGLIRNFSDINSIKELIDNTKEKVNKIYKGENHTLVRELINLKVEKRKSKYSMNNQRNFEQIRGIYQHEYLIDIRKRKGFEVVTACRKDEFILRGDSATTIYFGKAMYADPFASLMASSLTEKELNTHFKPMEVQIHPVHMNVIRTIAANQRWVYFRDYPGVYVNESSFGGIKVNRSKDVKRFNKMANLYRVIIELEINKQRKILTKNKANIHLKDKHGTEHIVPGVEIAMQNGGKDIFRFIEANKKIIPVIEKNDGVEGHTKKKEKTLTIQLIDNSNMNIYGGEYHHIEDLVDLIECVLSLFPIPP